MMINTATFDAGMTDALLAMAAQEGLIEAGPKDSDYMFKGIASRPVPDWMKRQVMEQIVLTPTVLTQHDLSLGILQGQLLEEGNLQHIEPPANLLFRLNGYSSSIIGGMLRAQGFDIPESDLQPRLDRCRNALNEQEEVETRRKREFPAWLLIHRLMRRGTTPKPDDFTDEELDAQEARERVYQDAAPLIRCMEEYLDLASIAHTQNTLLTTPIETTLDSAIIPPSIPREGEPKEIALVRIVARDLGKLSFRPTLRESLKLSQDPATVALRELLPIWLDEIATGKIDKAQLVQREIAQANRALKVATIGGTVSNLTTWLSIPLLTLDSLIKLAPSVGWAVGVIGTGGLAAASEIHRRYRWATFGNT